MEIECVPTMAGVGRQAEGCIPACIGMHVTAGMQAGFKLRSVEYAAKGYFFFSVSQGGS